MELEDRLLQGAIDLHAHAFPEFSLKIRGRVHGVEWAELARAAGMRAIVMKSQVFPTVEKAQVIGTIVSGIEVFGGIALNHSIGGLNLLAVEAAGELGGKLIWMPTWSSKNDLTKSQFYLNRMKGFLKTLGQVVPGPEAGIDLLENGKLRSVVKEIVEIARDHQMVVSSGHVSFQESLALAKECAKQAVPFLFAHPFSRSVAATIAEQKEVANEGGYVEHCFITTMPMHQKIDISRIVESIREVGPQHTVLTTDGGQNWNAPVPELMRMYIASLLHLNVDEDSIRKMVQENPAKILGLKEASKDLIK